MRVAVFCRPSRPDPLCYLIQGLRASRLPLATFFRAFGARRIPTLVALFRAAHTNAHPAPKARSHGAHTDQAPKPRSHGPHRPSAEGAVTRVLHRPSAEGAA
jgi:hypothetical protein